MTDLCPPFSLSRRQLLAAGASAAACSTFGLSRQVRAAQRWIARPPAGFVRLSLPGRVVKVRKGNSMQANGAYPKADAARVMLARAMTELTGKATVAAAFKQFIHPDDVVAIKPNGIAGRKSMKMAANKELIIEVVKGVMAAGVPAERITVFEQYRDFLFATRIITDKTTLAPTPELPPGVNMAVHLNKDAKMDSITVGGIPTKYVTPFTNATAVINVTQIKDHSICGYTGALKNITHGCNINPHHFHEHTASPQIAHLYSQGVVKSRVALHITDGYQVIYDEGPIDRNPRRRVPHEAVYASTDPVALDVIGWKVVEQLRKKNGLPTLKAARRDPSYLRIAGELGLGVFDDNLIHLREVSL